MLFSVWGVLIIGLAHGNFDRVLEKFLFLFFISGVPQRLDTGDLGRPTRYCSVSYTHLTLPTIYSV